MRPLRAAVMSGILQRFVRAFFDENPLSQLGLIVLRNGVAERLTELSSSPVRRCTTGRWVRGGGAPPPQLVLCPPSCPASPATPSHCSPSPCAPIL